MSIYKIAYIGNKQDCEPMYSSSQQFWDPFLFAYQATA